MAAPALILDYAMATPEINERIAFVYIGAGCRVDYRPFFPDLENMKAATLQNDKTVQLF
ncbi:MAG: hypothetical protein QF879_05465 [Candidatus Latescibacteria bacterium]|jgi:hypothetical protein|nr:hypothetical protein [Candidatus Latescibacterota bacterium]